MKPSELRQLLPPDLRNARYATIRGRFKRFFAPGDDTPLTRKILERVLTARTQRDVKQLEREARIRRRRGPVQSLLQQRPQLRP